ncbi:MAG: hypothetical protein ACUVXI_04125 [bacterium]
MEVRIREHEVRKRRLGPKMRMKSAIIGYAKITQSVEIPPNSAPKACGSGGAMKGYEMTRKDEKTGGRRGVGELTIGVDHRAIKGAAIVLPM